MKTSQYIDRFEERINKNTYAKVREAILQAMKDVKEKSALFWAENSITELDTPYKILNTKRYQNLEKELKQIIFNLEANEHKLIQNSSMEVYQQVFNLTRYEVNSTLGLGMNFTKFDRKALLKAIENPINGLKLSDTLKKHRNDIINKLNVQLGQQIITGNSYREVAKAITGIFGKNDDKGARYKALSTVWTENHRVKELSKYESEVDIAKRYDIDITKIWDSTKDSRTRRDHVNANGQRRKLNENFRVGQSQGLVPGNLFGSDSAKQNINCRCTVLNEYEGEVPPDFNNEEWKEYMNS